MISVSNDHHVSAVKVKKKIQIQRMAERSHKVAHRDIPAHVFVAKGLESQEMGIDEVKEGIIFLTVKEMFFFLTQFPGFDVTVYSVT